MQRIKAGLLALAFIVCGLVPASAWTNVAHTQWGTQNTSASSAINTTGATLFTLTVCTYQPGGSVTVSDSVNSTTGWSLVASESGGGGNSKAWLFENENPTTGASQTFTVTGTGVYFNAQIATWSGAAASSILDQSSVGTSSSATTVQPGSLTAANASSLYLTVGCPDITSSATLAIDSGFTIIDQNVNIAATSLNSGNAYIVSSSALNPTWSNFTIPGVNQTVMATFNPGSSPPPPTGLPLRSLLGVGQ